ncbi:MAG: DUF2304 domain-containing protein [Candidatus Bathyarchaeia archaeon]
MLEPYGFAALFVGAAMAAYTIREYRRGRLRLTAFIVWMLVWLGLAATGIFPQMYVRATLMLGMATPIHFVTTFSIVVLFAIAYQLYRMIGEINMKVARLVQHLALQQSDEESD